MHGLTAHFLLLTIGFAGTVQESATDQQSMARDEELLHEAGFGADGKALLEFFRQRTLNPEGLRKITHLIAQLGDNAYSVRARASVELMALGSAAMPFLREAEKSNDLEVSHRAEECLRRIANRESRLGVPAAAARLLGQRKPPGTAETLLGFLPFAEDEMVADEIEIVLAGLAKRDPASEKVLIMGLADVDPIRREAAAAALCRAGASASYSDVRRLLSDRDPIVRLRAGIALATVKEKEAIPVIIDLLTELTQARAWQAEEILLRLAGESGPQVTWKSDKESRQNCRDAWMRWWTENRASVDLARLDRQERWLGYTMLVLLDAGRIIELDVTNSVRLTIDGLKKPLDAQMLPGDRVLVAEHDANRVTIRDSKSGIVWEKKVSDPLVAQRLLNGNTFIATENQLLEVDRDGKEIFSYARPGGEGFMKAQKLPNGDIAYVTTLREFKKMDSTGREMQSFRAEVSTLGGRIDVLPRGHVLVPEMNNNQVVEYDANGHVVWRQMCLKPVAAVRLANGNTLITSMHETNRAVEVDRFGKEAWEYQTSTRVTRAFRR